MACTYGYLGALSLVLTTACSGDNPLFHLGTVGGGTTEVGETTNGQGTTTTPTSDATNDVTSDPTTTDGSGSIAASGTSESASVSDSEDSTHPSTTTTDPNTTTDPVDSSSGSTGGISEKCGNGVPEVGEECDDGGMNGNGGKCTSECKADICGNQYIGPGEQCDDGKDNSPTGTCTPLCLNNVCGDGYPSDSTELCDKGGDNGKEIGGCSADCQVKIPDKILRIAQTPTYPGNLFKDGNTGIAGADKLCNFHHPGYKAMLVGSGRIASTGDYTGAGQSDWPVQKYQAYTRKDGITLVFVTGGEGLIGVHNNGPAPLQASIGANDGFVWTGAEQTWKSTPNNCTGWTKKDELNFGQVGDASAVGGEFIAVDKLPCEVPAGIYCVEVGG